MAAAGITTESVGASLESVYDAAAAATTAPGSRGIATPTAASAEAPAAAVVAGWLLLLFAARRRLGHLFWVRAQEQQSRCRRASLSTTFFASVFVVIVLPLMFLASSTGGGIAAAATAAAKAANCSSRSCGSPPPPILDTSRLRRRMQSCCPRSRSCSRTRDSSPSSSLVCSFISYSPASSFARPLASPPRPRVSSASPLCFSLLQLLTPASRRATAAPRTAATSLANTAPTVPAAAAATAAAATNGAATARGVAKAASQIVAVRSHTATAAGHAGRTGAAPIPAAGRPPGVTQGIRAAAESAATAAAASARRAAESAATAAGIPASTPVSVAAAGYFLRAGAAAATVVSPLLCLPHFTSVVPVLPRQQQQQLQKKKEKRSFLLATRLAVLQSIRPACSGHSCSISSYSNMTGGAETAAPAAVVAVNGGEEAMALSDEELRREAAIFKALDAMAIDYKVYRHRRLMTVNDLLKEPVLQGAGRVVANLFLKDKKKGFFLVSTLHDSPTPMKGLGKLLQAANLRLAADDALGTLLDVEQGAVTPLAVISDTRKEVQVVMDERLRESSNGPVLVHPLHNKATLAMAAADLIKFVEAHGHTIHWIDCQEALKLASSGGGRAGGDAGAGKETAAKAGGAAAGGREQQQRQRQQPNGERLAGGGAAAAGAADGCCMLGVTVKKAENFPEWYTQVILRSEMIEYYDVSGCYIMRPWSFFIWETVQRFFDAAIKEKGVQNAYFPMFVSKQKLEKEKDHIAGFSPEVAWVTHYGDSPLAEKIAIRPTSETIMYPAYAKWIRSHRDLPLKLNQWCSVVRWEFKQPTPFLRTREFLWQEGHTAHATEEEAMEMVLEILELYRRWYEEYLAVPVIRGEKSENEKFAGGVKTTTCESFIAENGRGVQAATSHFLGTNFSKMFEIQFEDEDGRKQLAHQTSWGCTTRSLGVMVMVHGDDKGLVLPPRVAPLQVIIVPILFKDAMTKEILAQCDVIHATLKKAGIRSKVDDRANYTPGWKFNNWEMKGVPLRVEVGPRDVAKGTARVVRRDNGAAMEVACDSERLVNELQGLLQTIQQRLFDVAKDRMQQSIERITSFEEVMPALNRRHLILAPWCEDPASEEAIKKETQRLSELQVAAAAGGGGAGGECEGDTEEQQQQQSVMTGAMKCLCIPFDQPPMPDGTKCFFTGKPAKRWSLWGRSY